MLAKLFPTLKPRGGNAPLSQGAAFVVRSDGDRGHRNTVLFGASPNRVKVAGGDSDGAISIFEYEGHIQGGPPLHVHHEQDEVYFVRDGAYTFEVGGVRHDLAAGDTIFLPRGIPHAFAQRSETGRLLFMFTPAGSMEAYFEALGAFKGPPEPKAEAALFAAHGMTLVGPPMSFD
jgi:mannose-6-phosphate isomerase-like protein (cupin superfamily)